jgi:hypothetical protein
VATRRCANEDAPWPAPKAALHVPGCKL